MLTPCFPLTVLPLCSGSMTSTGPMNPPSLSFDLLQLPKYECSSSRLFVRRASEFSSLGRRVDLPFSQLRLNPSPFFRHRTFVTRVQDIFGTGARATYINLEPLDVEATADLVSAAIHQPAQVSSSPRPPSLDDTEASLRFPGHNALRQRHLSVSLCIFGEGWHLFELTLVASAGTPEETLSRLETFFSLSRDTTTSTSTGPTTSGVTT